MEPSLVGSQIFADYIRIDCESIHPSQVRVDQRRANHKVCTLSFLTDRWNGTDSPLSKILRNRQTKNAFRRSVYRFRDPQTYALLHCSVFKERTPTPNLFSSDLAASLFAVGVGVTKSILQRAGSGVKHNWELFSRRVFARQTSLLCFHAISANGHAAPSARSVLRTVVECPAAVLLAAGFQTLPRSVPHRIVGDREDLRYERRVPRALRDQGRRAVRRDAHPITRPRSERFHGLPGSGTSVLIRSFQHGAKAFAERSKRRGLSCAVDGARLFATPRLQIVGSVQRVPACLNFGGVNKLADLLEPARCGGACHTSRISPAKSIDKLPYPP